MLKQSLSQKMLQKLSPQQIQLMKLLQIPTATLEERIKEELEANPALEEGDDDYNDVFDLDNAITTVKKNRKQKILPITSWTTTSTSTSKMTAIAIKPEAMITVKKMTEPYPLP